MSEKDLSGFKTAMKKMIDEAEENESLVIVSVKPMDEEEMRFQHKSTAIIRSRGQIKLLIVDLLGLAWRKAMDNADFEFAGQLEGLRRGVGDLFEINLEGEGGEEGTVH